MTISAWLMMLALAAGSGAGQLSGSNSMVQSTGAPPKKIENHCWINGVWYNPCPSESEGPPPAPLPEVQPPS